MTDLDHSMRFGFSPCPNDTFAFHALVHGLVDCPVRVEPVMADIEQLNRRARQHELGLTKLSIGALAALGDSYVPLRSGAALGHGVGPLVVARRAMSLEDAAGGRIAVPGHATTAMLLLRLAAGDALGETVELRYDEILGAVARGDVDAGLIIHESRFTYADHGLVRVADLGAWWEAHTGLPTPLAVIAARADIPAEVRDQLERAIRDSVTYAIEHPAASRAWTRSHAQELSDDVCRAHIDLYVNEHSVHLDDNARLAIDSLLRAAHSGTVTQPPSPSRSQA